MPFARANDLRFHYQQAGAGPDVVLLHGLTGDLSVWLLCQAIQKLSRSYRVTAFDLRGHGYSDVPPSGYTSADHATDLFSLLDYLGAERAHVVGHSFGGVIALHAAVLKPERITSIVLSDPYFPALRHLEDASRWGHWDAFRQEALDAGVVLSDQHWYDLGHFFGQVQHLDGERMLKFRQAVGLPGLNRLKRLSETTCGVDSRVDGGLTVEKIASMSRPALALYGELSPFLATAYYLEEHLPDCRVAIVPGAKHRAPQENGESFLEAIRAFLESVEPSRTARPATQPASESPAPC
ncbi:MAG: alpha/beta hydrolase [Isosphaeraceae bacterium]|nr:alpha/beta hydrolase [Isosphaeraceae bacterium]